MPEISRKIFLIGGYESAGHVHFPIVTQPILAEFDSNKYFRVNYRFSCKGCIRVEERFGIGKYNSRELFPHATFLFCSPQELQPRSTLIFLDPEFPLYGARLSLTLRMAFELLRGKYSRKRVFACLVELWM